MASQDWSRTVISLCEIAAALLTVTLSLIVTYRWFAPAVLKGEIRSELLRGNTAFALVLGTLLASPTLVVLSTLGPIIFHVRTYFLLDAGEAFGVFALIGIAIGYVAAVLSLALITTWIAIRIFEAMTRGIDEMAEIRRGNLAVAILLSAVIVVVAFFTQIGISALASSLVPQTPLGEVKYMS
jgi:uncharacterized membrane protein YjfL (UPF0719 family)